MQTIATTLALATALTLALHLGRVLPMVLPSVSPLFNRKPFNCRPCTTFHLTWLFMGLVAMVAGQGWLAVMGVAIAFIVFAVIRHMDNKKIID